MNIQNWLNENKNTLKNEGYISIHLDELGVVQKYLKNGIIILNELINELNDKKIDLSDIKVELQFELINMDVNFMGVPNSLDSLNTRISNVPPEIIVSKRTKGYIDYIPKIEYYMSPLPFSDNELDNSLIYSYTEYRTIEDLHNNEGFTSWLNVVWVTP